MRFDKRNNLVYSALFLRILMREWRLLSLGALSISLSLALAIGVRFAVKSPTLSFAKRIADIEASGWVGPIEVHSYEAEQALQHLLGDISWVEVVHQKSISKVTSTNPSGRQEEKQFIDFVFVTDARFTNEEAPNDALALNKENTAWIPENSCLKNFVQRSQIFLETDAVQFSLDRVETVKPEKFPIFESCSTMVVFARNASLKSWVDLNLADSKSVYLITEKTSSLHLSERLSLLAQAIPGLSYQNAIQRVSRLQLLSASFDLNLQIMGLISLFVGAFMVYQVMSLLLARYASHFAILHAQGVSFQRQFTPLLMLVSVLALFATLFGTFMGYGFASFISRYTGEAVRTLYESLVPANSFSVDKQDLILAVIYGFGSCFAGASRALLRIFGLDSAQVLRTGAWHGSHSSQRHQHIVFLAHIFLLLLCLLICLLAISAKVPEPQGSKIPYGGLAACFALLIANIYICRGGHLLLAALRKVLPELTVFLSSKAALITQVLGLAFCLAIGVKTMSESFRTSLLEWANATMNADVWLRSKLGPTSPISKVSFETVQSFVSSLADTQMDVLYRLEANWQLSGTQESQPIILNVNRFEIHRSHQPLKFLAGPLAHPELEKVIEDAKSCEATRSSPCPAFVSESACIHAALPLEDCAVWQATPQALQSGATLQNIVVQNKSFWFRYYKAFQDFNDTGTLQIDEHTARRLFDLPKRPFFVNVYFAKTLPKEQKAALIAEFKKQLSSDPGLNVMSLEEIKNSVIKTFEETFRVTDALYLVCVLISFVTVLSSLYLQFIVRKLEWAVLWACVYSKSQISAKLSFYSGIQAAAAVVFSAPAGYCIAWMLVKIINKRAFGFSLEFHPSGTVVTVLAVAATVTGALGTLIVTRKLLTQLSALNLNLE